MDYWLSYLISIAIGLLVGLERERAHPQKKAMGIRTFLLVSILGAIAGDHQETWISFLITLFAFSLITGSYFIVNKSASKQRSSDMGLTTEFAAGIIYCLAFISHTHLTQAAVLGPLIALILFSKIKLHQLSYEIKTNELEAALLLIFATVCIISLVPDKALDPWGVFNLRKFGILVLILGGLEFLSYLLIKLLGAKKGTLIVGFLGGLVSSTAVLLSNSKKAQANPETWNTALISTIAAKLSAALELLLIVGAISHTLFLQVLPAMIAGIAVGALGLLSILKISSPDLKADGIILKSPLDWVGVFRLSILLASILGLISITKHSFGDQASFVVSFLTGLFELHGVSLANATMFAHDKISLDVASLNILLAFNASLIAKIFMSWIFCKNKFSKYLSILFLLMIISASGVLWWGQIK